MKHVLQSGRAFRNTVVLGLLLQPGAFSWAVSLQNPNATAAGNTLLEERRYGAAMDQFEIALKHNPQEERAREGETKAANALALEYLQQQHPEQAMEALERALALLPNEPDLLLNFGIEATVMKQFPIAEQALQAADRSRPNDPKTIYARGRLAVEEQHLPEAVADLKRYTALRPNDASAFFGLGHVYAMQQQYDLARAAFEQSVKLQPLQTESYYQLGQLDLQVHQDAQAENDFKKVLARFPQHAGALTGLGQIALRAKEYARAEQYLADAERSDPTYQTPHYFRGLALAKLGRKEEAEQELQRGDSRQHVTSPAADDVQAGGTSQPR